MLTRRTYDYAIDLKKGFVPRKEKVYSLSREERDEVRYFLQERKIESILDIIENIGTKKLFTKLDLRWGYNNIRIKERNEWKVAFTTLEGLFEPIVMFFGLTNSLAMFQAIMNQFLRNLINIGKVRCFVDNIMIGTESKEGHDELMEEWKKC